MWSTLSVVALAVAAALLASVLSAGVGVTQASASSTAPQVSTKLQVSQSWYYAGLNTADMVSTNGGNLILSATRGDVHANYHTSEVDTGYFTYGTVNVRAKMSAGVGMWPGIWMVPQTQTPGVRPSEIDLVEVAQSAPGQTNIAHVTYHWTDGSGQAWQYGAGIHFPFDLTQTFHNYRVVWTANQVDYYIDTTHVMTVNSNPARSTGGAFAKITASNPWVPAKPASVSIYHGPMKIRINNGVGLPGTLAGTPNASTVFPNSLDVSSITVTPPVGPALAYNSANFDWTPRAVRATPTLPAAAPTTPTGVTAAASPTTTGAATVSWSAPTNNGGSPITGYQVTGSPGGTCTSTTSSCTVTGLTPGQAYTFTVTATNNAGTSLASSSSSPATLRAIAPAAPAGVAAIPSQTIPSTANVSWTAPTNNGGSPITGYQVTGSPSGTCTSTTNSCTVTGLTPGQSYTFTVTATNNAGTSPASSPSSPVTVIPTTTRPTLDTVGIGYRLNASSTVSQVGVSTSGAGELLLAFVQAGGPAGMTQAVRTVTGAGLTWTRASYSNPTGGGTNEVWQAWAPSQITNSSVTATLATPADGMLTIQSYKDAAHSLGAVQIGVLDSSSSVITPVHSNSLIVSGGLDSTSATKPIPAAAQSLTTYILNPGAHHTYWTQSVRAATAARTPINVNATVRAADSSSMIAVEVPPQS